MKPLRFSSSRLAPSISAYRSMVAEKLAEASAMCARLSGTPYTDSSHAPVSRIRRLSRACTRRMRTESFQPSPSRSSALGSMISMKCRVFWRMRRSPKPPITRPLA